jgi:hypothetical protein
MRMVNRFIAFAITSAAVVTLSAQESKMPKTTKETVTGTPSIKTEKLQGTVVFAQGNDLVVKMSTGEVREFHTPESRRFIIDGKELTTSELKPGTKLNATITTTRTPVIERTTTIGTGKVWWVSGNSVIVTLPNNENRMYKVNDDYRFNVDGRPASVHDLRQGMVISAQKIVEEPRSEIATNTEVTGTAPPPPVVAQAPPPQRAPAPTPAPAPAPPPAPVRTAPPAQVAQATPPPSPPEPAPEPKRLPSTASNLALIGIAGLCLIGGSLCLRRLRA